MKNYIVRVISEQANVIGLACVTTGLVNESCQLHGAYPTACAALGRALTGGALMASLLKMGQRLALKFEGNGPLKKIIVEADYEGNIRGFMGVPEVDLPPRNGKFDVSGAVGKEGVLTVIKDTGRKELYNGVVKIRTGEIAEDIAYYFAESEQIPTAVALGVYMEPSLEITAAGGFLVQSLPPSDENMIDRLIENIRKLPSYTQMIRSGQAPESILEAIFSGIPYVTLERHELFYRCTCSRERIEKILVSLGREELADMIEKQGRADVTCEFCRKRYSFNGDELGKILADLQGIKKTA
ncbi:MAG: Hsp33 family molecular chaperone HslO [Deltaproteobacteria bacterium]|nr:Hsp33 family molecular chaperone HslO [Deltaproteobacteria bacterium]